MPLRAGVVREYCGNFVLDEGKLRKINSVLTEYGHRLDPRYHTVMHVVKEDEQYYTTASVDDVLGEDNAPHSRVTGLTVRLQLSDDDGKSDDYRATVSFSPTERARVSLGVRGVDREWCILLADELDVQIRRTIKKRPFRLLSSQVADHLLISAIFMAVLTWVSVRASRKPPLFSEAEVLAMSVEQRTKELLVLAVKRGASDQWALSFLIVLLALWMLLPMSRPVSRIGAALDCSAFYWGDSVSAFDQRQMRLSMIQWGVIVAFFVSLLATIIGSVLMT